MERLTQGCIPLVRSTGGWGYYGKITPGRTEGSCTSLSVPHRFIHLRSQMFTASLAFFDTYGKLRTKLQKIELENPELVDDRGNRGVSSIRVQRRKVDHDDEDPVWKSSVILDELERFEQNRTAVKQERSLGVIPSVPWLDYLTKERCDDELTDISAIYDEVCSIFGTSLYGIEDTHHILGTRRRLVWVIILAFLSLSCPAMRFLSFTRRLSIQLRFKAHREE